MRAPVDVRRLTDAAQLGELLEFRLEDGTGWTWTSPRPLVLTDAKRRLVFWVEGKTTTTDLEPSKARALRAWRVWTEYEPTKVIEAKATIDTWRRLGRAAYIAYRTTRKGPSQDYEHPFDSPVSVHQSGRLVVLTGPKLRVDARGIHG